MGEVPDESDGRKTDQRDCDVEGNIERLLAPPSHPANAAEGPDDELRRRGEMCRCDGVGFGWTSAGRKRGRADLCSRSQDPRAERRFAPVIGQIAVKVQEHILGELFRSGGGTMPFSIMAILARTSSSRMRDRITTETMA